MCLLHFRLSDHCRVLRKPSLLSPAGLPQARGTHRLLALPLGTPHPFPARVAAASGRWGRGLKRVVPGSCIGRMGRKGEWLNCRWG